jgi:Zn finger protein HypA/HybF involved in hydrogenase expression
MNNHIKSLANGDFEVKPLDDPDFLAFQERRNRCTCHKCYPIDFSDPYSVFMRLCPECGNKRCPKASNHELACTNSNDPGQEGSIY